ncbi:hypothetical protein RF679_03675 [Undibacterium cyanobacteriorum]|uniref:Uncharacterized protein n=1 Tax=Undibacterium cyanobacteriorum TaxID=3073561 RepID=A0ABY9RN25_9BURK|nr:hypothetical protein [Undibacterium sp. 20NA77.5]WMW81386.1 hypothetical protein RF679_03675 [Undibacterium sp. 20NA77.5]
MLGFFVLLLIATIFYLIQPIFFLSLFAVVMFVGLNFAIVGERNRRAWAWVFVPLCLLVSASVIGLSLMVPSQYAVTQGLFGITMLTISPALICYCSYRFRCYRRLRAEALQSS